MTETKVANPNSDMGIGDTLKKAWEMFIQNWKFLAIVWLIGLAISAVLVVLAIIFTGIFGVSLAGIYKASTGSIAVPMLGALTLTSFLILLILCVIGILLGSWIGGAYVYAIYSVANSKKMEAWGCFQMAWKKIWTFFGLGILSALMIGIGLMLLVIPGIIFAILLFFAFYLVVAEDLGAFSAIGRSFNLAAKKWLEIFVLSLIVGAIAWLLSYIPVVNLIVSTAATFFVLLIAAVLYKKIK